MGTAAEQVPTASFERYLRAEQDGDRRHEYVGGRVLLMSGGTERHDLAAGLVYEAVAGPARAAGCRPFMANRLIRVGAAAYYPDVMIVPGRAADRLYEDDALLVVEVSSPSTRDTDRREKATAYLQLPSVLAYLLVEPEHRHVELGTPGPRGWRWQACDGGSVPVPLGGWGVTSLDVTTLYDTLDATATS